jgi:hypothetical protein
MYYQSLVSFNFEVVSSSIISPDYPSEQPETHLGSTFEMNKLNLLSLVSTLFSEEYKPKGSKNLDDDTFCLLYSYSY